ncbi:MAG: hypothetical protein Q7J48_15600 [Nocardioides sp.]|nr:hypothetical protein [Nocardioides sp.]
MNDAQIQKLFLLLERLPQMRPFTSAMARAEGVGWPELRALVALEALRHPLQGVYCSSRLADDLAYRLEVLRLVVPPDCVVTDRTAGWLWGAPMALAPNDHLVTPTVSVFAPPGRRLRNGLSSSGERRLATRDVAEIDGLLVTTPLRTACDLGRLLHRDQSLGAMDALARLGRFDLGELSAEMDRFKGYRGVVQLRALVPLVDPKAESQAESALRLRWVDIGLPRPRCQVPVPAPRGGLYFLDIGLEQRRLAAEYDGEEWHGDEQRAHDEERRAWCRDHEGWTIVVVRRANLYGRHQNAEQLLLEGNLEAMRALRHAS